MRRLAILAIVLTSATATAAGAQSITSQPDNSAAALARAAFAPTTGLTVTADIGHLLDHQVYDPGVGLVRWTTGQMQLSNAAIDGPIDSLRVSVGGDLHTPGGLPLNLSRAQFESRAYEVSLIRDWPAAVSFDSKNFKVDVSPHAGVGVSNLGGSAEAGAMLRLSRGASRDQQAKDKLRELGIGDGARLGGAGRWYLYAAASGRAVGLNMTHNTDTGWDRRGWTTDSTSALIGDAQLGVGYRKGGVQSSLGYVHREVKGKHMIWGQQTRSDSMLAFSLTIHPQR